MSLRRAESVEGLWPIRYAAMDAWRGLAALGVVLTHVTRNLFGVEHEWRIGHECVLLFFVISGYCITASSESTARIGFRGFMKRRVRRIYPPYFFAVVFYAVTRFAKVAIRHAPLPASWTGLGWIQNLTLTQWVSMLRSPSGIAWGNPVNFVPAFWSLQHEEQFYLVSGLMLLVLPAVRLSATFAMMAVSLAWIALAPLITTTPYHGVFLEMWFYFGLGAVVFHRLCRFRRPAVRWLVDGSLGAGAAVTAVLWLVARSRGSVVAEPLRHVLVVACFSLFLIVLRPLDGWLAARAWFRPFLALGLVTYSLYLVHQFNVVAVASLVGALVPDRWLAVSIASQTAVHVAIAVVFWRFCERPFLNRPVPTRVR